MLDVFDKPLRLVEYMSAFERAGYILHFCPLHAREGSINWDKWENIEISPVNSIVALLKLSVVIAGHTWRINMFQ